MKTNKVLAVALSAGLVLGGASIANAAAGDKYESREAAEAAAKEDLKNDQINNSYEITGEKEEWYYVLKFDQEKAIAEEKEAEEKKPLKWLNASFQVNKDGKWVNTPGAVIEVRNENGELVHTFTTNDDRVWQQLPEGNYTATVVSVPLDEGTYEWRESMTQPVYNGPGSVAFHVYEIKPEDKKTQTLDEWQIEQNEKDGYFTEEDAKRAGELALDKAELRGLYEVEVRKNAAGDRWYWRFVPVEKAEEEKPDIPWTPLEPAEPIPEPGTPWTPLTPADPIVPGGDNEVVIPGEKPEDKPEDNKGTEIEEEKPNEGKDKDEKAKPSKETPKPANQKGNNPKTGLVGLAPIYSTLAISMAGIVAARKKND